MVVKDTALAEKLDLVPRSRESGPLRYQAHTYTLIHMTCLVRRSAQGQETGVICCSAAITNCILSGSLTGLSVVVTDARIPW